MTRASKPKKDAQAETSKRRVRQSRKSALSEASQDPLLLERDPDKLMGSRKKPKYWDLMSFEEKLEFIASRLLAEDRHGVTSHKALKETGILSSSQYERRRNREVYSQFGSLDEIKPAQGSFSRSHVRDLRGYKAAREWEEKQRREAQEKAEDTKGKKKTKTTTTKATKKTVTKKSPVKKTKKKR